MAGAKYFTGCKIHNCKIPFLTANQLRQTTKGIIFHMNSILRPLLQKYNKDNSAEKVWYGMVY